jgi:4-hydroxy-3-polyprenylbenzoate decarboxylase
MTTTTRSQEIAFGQWADLREWLDAIDALGELRTLRGVDSEAGIGEVTELLDSREGSPAVLFDQIPGFAPGYRVLVNALGTRGRQAATYGIDPQASSHNDLMSFWRAKLRAFDPVEPIEVGQGPILENVLRDDEVDLTRFPAPIWHPGDGGRFIGTASINILRDPDTGAINAGTYRNQLFDATSVGTRPAPTHHGGVILNKYMSRGEPCPIVIVVGSDPLLFLAACLEGPAFGESELAWAGGVRGRPVPVIRGEITGLPIPANAEIALEGFVTTDEFHKEGPYGEWMGYYHDGFERERVVRISRVYHRSDPIILGCPQGKPPHEDNRFLAYVRSAMIWDQLEKAGVPGIRDVWSAPEGGNRLLTIVAVDTQYVGHGRQAAHVAAMCGAAVDMNRLTIAVGAHVEVTSMQDVLWAVLTRVDPVRDIDLIPGTKGSRIDMAIGPAERGLSTTSRMVIDATIPFGWKTDPLAGDVISDATRAARIRERWSSAVE